MPLRNEDIKYRSIQYAFKKDCENLLSTFSRLGSFSYEDFARVWTDMSFSLIFSGKSPHDEIRNFTEMCLFEAKKFLVYSKNIYIQVGALYLLYGLYYKQPLKNFVKIRLTKSDYTVLNNVFLEMKEHKQLEFLYIFFKMKTDSVIDYVYTDNEMTPESRHFSDNLIMKDDIFQFDPIDSIEGQIKSIISNEDVSKVNDQYEKALKEYAEANSESGLLSFKSINILKEIKSIYEPATQDKKPEKEAKMKVHDIGETRQKIKVKAMSKKRK